MLNYIQCAILLAISIMTRKKIDKKIPRLEPEFHNILVCKKNDCRPFLEVLIEAPENISHQNLGTLVGIFQIDDRSEDSSYVVNYLISIIKKEYFSHINRGSVENFEAALHKANLALAKLATHENIGWIGKINALCAVIEKNNLLLSQTGNASAFLLRGTMLTEITEAPLEEADSNPLKTFQDVISGKIEKNDKLIFTTKELFDIFSLEEIKKSALKFSRENFLQFLNTALVNELDQVATLIIDISEKEVELIENPSAKKMERTNVFSQTAFQKELSPKMLEKERAREAKVQKERQALIQELKEDTKDFVDKKTGHIYIKEPRNFSLEDSEKKTGIDFTPIREKFFHLLSSGFSLLGKAGNSTGLIALSLWRKGVAKSSRIRLKQKVSSTENLVAKREKPAKPKPEIIPSVNIKTTASLEEKMKTAYSDLKIETGLSVFWKMLKQGVSWFEDATIAGLIWLLRKPTKLTLSSTRLIKNKWQVYRTEKITKKYSPEDSKPYPWENIATASQPTKPPSALWKKTAEPEKPIATKKILPDFSRLKQITRNLDRKQKIFALVALALLLVVPYWIVRWENTPEAKPTPVAETPPIIVPLEKDLAVLRIEKLTEVHAGNILKIINLNNKFFALTETEIIDLENKKSISLPSDFQNPELFFGMDDLNLLFLVKHNQIVSLAPTTEKFVNNNLAFPENIKIITAETYLTYLYLFDQNNQIYRYPRAEGGFGEKTAWLKETLTLSNIKTVAINENVFVAGEDAVIKLFRGKKIDFSIEKTATPIKFTKLYTKRDSSNLYVLDNANARVVKLDNDGKILAQYYNAKIAEADDFSVNEENNLVYLSDKNGVESFEMNP